LTAGKFEDAAAALDREQTVQGLLGTACRELTERLDGRACVISRIVGDLLVGLSEYSRSGTQIGQGHEYLISDYPLTREVIEQGEARCLSRRDPDADVKEAALLEKLGFESLLMVCLPAEASCWGLVEVYGDDGGFGEDDAALAERIAAHAGERLAQLEIRRGS
jgi:GAF domain-containing protein